MEREGCMSLRPASINKHLPSYLWASYSDINLALNSATNWADLFVRTTEPLASLQLVLELVLLNVSTILPTLLLTIITHQGE